MRLTIAALALILGFTAVALADDDHRCHHITLHADDSPTANGAALYDLVTHIKDASATHPYMIHLEAGTYAVPTSIILLPYISLKGAGIASTIIEPLNTSLYTTVFFQDQVSKTYVQALSNESLSELTITGLQPLNATVNGFFALDHVQLISTAGGVNAIDLITAGSHFFVTDSLLGALQLDSAPGITWADGTVNPFSSIIGSEVDLDNALLSPFNVVCMSSYNVSGQQVSSTCH